MYKRSLKLFDSPENSYILKISQFILNYLRFRNMLTPNVQNVFSWHSFYMYADVFAFICRSRFCPKRLDVPLLRPISDADAGDHVDVFCAVWGWSSDCHLLRCVRRSFQTQRGLLCRLPTNYSASFRKRLWCGKKTVGGQRETGETGLRQQPEELFKFPFKSYLWSCT